MEVQPVGDQHDADQNQKRQRQHLDGGVFVDEIADRAGSKQHHGNGHANGGDHDRDMLGDTHGGKYRIQRENEVDGDDLHDDHGHHVGFRLGFFLVLSFHFMVDFHRCLVKQEQAAADKDNIAPGDILPQNGEQCGFQVRDPGDKSQQQNAHDKCQRKPDRSGESLLGLGQSAANDGKENDIVDAKDDFQHRQGQKTGPYGRIGYPFKH